MKITGKRIYLQLLAPENVSPDYVSWMQDPEILQYLESRWRMHTTEDIREYIRHTNSSGSDFLFGMFLIDGNTHIGNIKIGGINQLHRFGDIGLLIGRKDMWGKGYGAEAIGLATQYAFKELNLNKLIAGIYANNTGSYKAFIKNGYREIGIMKKHRFHKGSYVDEVLMEKGRE